MFSSLKMRSLMVAPSIVRALTGKLLVASMLVLGAASITGCQVDDSTPENVPAGEQAGQQIDQAALAIEVATPENAAAQVITRGQVELSGAVKSNGSGPGGSGSGGWASGGSAMGLASPTTTPASDGASSNGANNGGDPPPDAKASNNESATSRNGTTQMDPEPCPWTQKNGSK